MKKLVLAAISFYQKFVSPLFLGIIGPGCRYSPSCSEYAKIRIGRYGILKGGRLALKRLARCHPFTKTPAGLGN